MPGCPLKQYYFWYNDGIFTRLRLVARAMYLKITYTSNQVTKVRHVSLDLNGCKRRIASSRKQSTQLHKSQM
jgi:hypothetical protein